MTEPVLVALDTKINTRDDLENGLQDISILGEVPLDEDLKEGQNDVRGITAESILAKLELIS